MRADRIDFLAVAATLLVLVDAVGYIALLAGHQDEPVIWLLGVLAGAALLAGYGAIRWSPGRRVVLALDGGVLVVVGTAGILTIGLPLLAAGVLALVSAVRPVAEQAER